MCNISNGEYNSYMDTWYIIFLISICLYKDLQKLFESVFILIAEAMPELSGILGMQYISFFTVVLNLFFCY